MERGVFEAALEGDVATLKRLLHEDPLILDRTIVNIYSETPLHVAAMLGYHDFVKEIITRKPKLVKELNSKHSSPLHLAAAKGHVDVVRALVLADPGMCNGRDRDGLTPLHLAAMKGRVEVLKELIDAISCRSGLIDMMGVDDERLGESILHMCVKHSQLEALKIVVEMIGDGGGGFVNCRDSFGNTILHLAVADKQFETVKYLLTYTTIEVDAEDLIGLTATDILLQTTNDNIAQLLMHKQGAKQPWQQHINNGDPQSQPSRNKKKSKRKKPIGNNNNTTKPPNAKEDWVQKMRDGLMVAASLLATMAFQAVVSPPGGLLQTNDTPIRQSEIQNNINSFFSFTGNSESFIAPAPSSSINDTLINATIGKSVMSYYKPLVYNMFLVANTTSFLASLSIILLLISGLPLSRKFFMFIMMIIMWVAITGMGLSYFFCINMITPERSNMNIGLYLYRIGACLLAGLAVILVLGHTIQMTIKMVKWVWRALRRKPKKMNSSSMDIDSSEGGSRSGSSTHKVLGLVHRNAHVIRRAGDSKLRLLEYAITAKDARDIRAGWENGLQNPLLSSRHEHVCFLRIQKEVAFLQVEVQLLACDNCLVSLQPLFDEIGQSIELKCYPDLEVEILFASCRNHVGVQIFVQYLHSQKEDFLVDQWNSTAMS
nr:ankyrin repeat-containing protein BDA1-like [Ipomoea batatas]